MSKAPPNYTQYQPYAEACPRCKHTQGGEHQYQGASRHMQRGLGVQHYRSIKDYASEDKVHDASCNRSRIHHPEAIITLHHAVHPAKTTHEHQRHQGAQQEQHSSYQGQDKGCGWHLIRTC